MRNRYAGTTASDSAVGQRFQLIKCEPTPRVLEQSAIEIIFTYRGVLRYVRLLWRLVTLQAWNSPL